MPVRRASGWGGGIVGVVALAVTALPPAAAADMPAVFTEGQTVGNDPVECIAQADGTRICESDTDPERVLSHDGLPPAERAPIDFTLRLPPDPGDGGDGMFPLVVVLHGWGADKRNPGGGLGKLVSQLVGAGYATLQYNARAWDRSCGRGSDPDPACAGVWTHMADLRYEVRDAQYLVGLLADERSSDGLSLIDPMKIGVTGISYGGGQSLMLAALKDRVMDLDGSLRPWVSPEGTPLRLAAAVPFWPWSDMSSMLMPNGSNLDYAADNPYRGPGGAAPVGVAKVLWDAGMYAWWWERGAYPPPGADPPVHELFARGALGEPYLEQDVGAMLADLSRYHSAYGLLREGAPVPAPTLINSGWADDIVPVDEATRFYNRARSLFPEAPVSIFASDYGHERAVARLKDRQYLLAAALEWFDFYLRGIGPQPSAGVRARTQACGTEPTEEFAAPDWAGLVRGEVRFHDASAKTAVSASGGGWLGDTWVLVGGSGARGTLSSLYEPASGPGTCVPDRPAAPGAALYRLPDVTAGGYTVLGAPTIVARMVVTGARAADAQIAARLVDVAPDGTRLVVARAVYRPDRRGRQVFQLHPMGHRVDGGHHLELELAGQDFPYARPSNAQFVVRISDLELRVPVREEPDGATVLAPAPVVLPPGYAAAPGYEARGSEPLHGPDRRAVPLLPVM